MHGKACVTAWADCKLHVCLLCVRQQAAIWACRAVMQAIKGTAWSCRPTTRPVACVCHNSWSLQACSLCMLSMTWLSKTGHTNIWYDGLIDCDDLQALCCIVQEAGSLEDPNWRVPDQRTMDQQYMGGGFTFAIPNAEFLDFSGPGGSALEASKPCPFGTQALHIP